MFRVAFISSFIEKQPFNGFCKIAVRQDITEVVFFVVVFCKIGVSVQYSSLKMKGYKFIN